MQNQRWRDHRDSYRPAGEVIKTIEYDVVALKENAAAKNFVLAHHYSRSYSSDVFRFGLFRSGQLVGVSVFGNPMRKQVISSILPGEPTASFELCRFVLLDEVPGNGETFFLSRCFSVLRREGVTGVVSFSDPCPRVDSEGRTVFLGHYGTIYQAFSAVFVGQGSKKTLRLLPDGSVLSARTMSKIRRREKGWRYGVRQLVRFGAEELRDGDAPGSWLNYWRAKLTRPFRHSGNFKYAWALDRSARKPLEAFRKPYPKRGVFGQID